jgi:hypothetical protein
MPILSRSLLRNSRISTNRARNPRKRARIMTRSPMRLTQQSTETTVQLLRSNLKMLNRSFARIPSLTLLSNNLRQISNPKMNPNLQMCIPTNYESVQFFAQTTPSTWVLRGGTNP